MLGLKPIPPETVPGIKKGDKRHLWYKGAIREVEVLTTYNHPKGICVSYETARVSGSMWVDISQLFLTEKECIKNHITKIQNKQAKTLANLKSQEKKLHEMDGSA